MKTVGSCAEETATQYKISRQEQDEHAISSYTRSAEAWKNGAYSKMLNNFLENEIAPVVIKDKKGEKTISVDEEYTNVDFSKIPKLNPVFQKGGTVTG